MAKRFIPYYPDTIEGQALLNNLVRSKRVLRYRDGDKVYERIKRGMPRYETETVESVGEPSQNLLLRGECISACAYLKESGKEIDLVYIDPPFASGADYAKQVYIRRNPRLAEKIAAAEERMDIEELRAFEEKMYGDIWNKEDYLSWMYENLTAIKSVMSDRASIYVHLDSSIGHYVKVLMDEVFGEENFINEIIWHYEDKFATGGKRLDKNHDSIFLYIKGENYIFNPIIIPKDEITKRALRKKVNGKTVEILDENGKKIIVEYHEKKADDVWDIGRTLSSEEWKNYATQKPEALLSRIVKASSNEGMTVADFFGGSGVTAKVANELGRYFVHVDVGINSIQTARDRLVVAKASFRVLDIKDGVSLFRNPVQTMDKIKTLIDGLQNDDTLDSFWEGSIGDSRLGAVPVYIPNLLDHSAKILDTPTMNRIVNEAIPNLPEDTKKVIVYYVDISDEAEVYDFIKEYGYPTIEIELRDLKVLLDDLIINDEIKYQISDKRTLIVSFVSDRLRQKIDEYNKKRELIGKTQTIAISDEGLELIEFLSLDCSNESGEWHSDSEIKIDKNGFAIKNGVKTKEFWDGAISFESIPKRLKIRNIAGDETIIKLFD